MARADLTEVIIDPSGNVQANTPVTVYEADGTTPYAGTLYTAASGGSVITPSASAPQTNSLGLLEIYGSSQQRVKLGVAGVQRNASLMPDAGSILTQNPGVMVNLDAGLTLTRNSGASATATALTLRDTDAAGYSFRIRNPGDTANELLVSASQVALTVPGSIAVTSTAYALGLRNNDPTMRALSVTDPTGTVVGVWDKLGLQLWQPSGNRMSRLSIGQGFLDTAHDDLFSLQIVQNVTGAGTGGTAAEVLVDYSVSNRDDSAFSIQARQLTTGNTALRPMDLNVLRMSGSGNAITMGLEVGFHSTIAPAVTDDYHIGIWLLQNAENFLSATAPLVAQAIGMKISGNSGWNDFVRYYATSVQAVGTAFRVSGGFRSGDRIGDVVTVGDVYTSGNGGTRLGLLNHINAATGATWAGMHFNDTQNALMLGARSQGIGYRPILLAPSGGAVGVGVPSSATIAAGTLFHVAGLMAAAATGASAAGPTYAFVGDTNTGMFSSAGDTLQFTTGGTERLRITSGGILDFHDPTTQSVAVGGATVATLSTLGTGPAVATMNSWLKIALNGTSAYLALWK